MRTEHKKTYYNDIALRLADRILGLKHLHFGYFSSECPPTLEGLREAQVHYMEVLLSFIPEGVHSVLDVGCGTGSVAKRLLEKGHEVTCIAPDPYLIEKTRQTTQNRVRTETELYENVTALPSQSFDMILMSESCQYVNVEIGWDQNDKYLKPGGYVLVLDFFKKNDEILSQISKSGHVLGRYLQVAEQKGFRLVKQKDITNEVTPTLTIYQELLDEKFFPVAEAVGEFLERRYPKFYKMFRWQFGEKLDQLQKKYQNQGPGAFHQHKTYQVLLFQKVQPV